MCSALRKKAQSRSEILWKHIFWPRQTKQSLLGRKGHKIKWIYFLYPSNNSLVSLWIKSEENHSTESIIAVCDTKTGCGWKGGNREKERLVCMTPNTILARNFLLWGLLILRENSGVIQGGGLWTAISYQTARLPFQLTGNSHMQQFSYK